ncbi:MAG: hypothetical protein JXA10_08020 [Anaerolineae bacterium]|nr:hypothetical protein [Anaerolineae bacterium]
MFNKRLIKSGLVMIAAVAVIAVALAWLVDTSAAQGPGGRGGSGRGGNGGNGVGLQDQDSSCDDCTGQQYGGNGNGNGGFGQYGSMPSGSSYQNRTWLAANLPPATPGDLPDDVIAALTAGIQDEYHAYATYQAVIDQFGAVRPFTSIQNSEAQHIDMLAFIFERYGLDVPAATSLDAAPVFASVQDACATGAAAEIANFGLYDQWLATVQDYPDIVQVFTMLRDASAYQHLPAFERCAG